MIAVGGRRGRRRRHLWGVVGAAVLLSSSAWGQPLRADENPLPGSCNDPSAVAADPACLLTPPETYPNLVPDVRFAYVYRELLGYDPDTFEPTLGPPELRFDTWAMNLGFVPLDLVVDDPSVTEATTASQCVAWEPDRVCRARREVGGFVWHDEHQHFHFQDFARFELRKLRRNGRIDSSKRGLLSAADKVSFCLIDTDQARQDAFPVGTYTGFCNPLRQGITDGWADVYGAGLPGQALSISGLEDGRYALVITINPAGRLHETDYRDNTVEAVVELANGLQDVTLVEHRRP